MASKPKMAPEEETELRRVAKRLAKDARIQESLRTSLLESQKGEVMTSEEAIKQLKKRAS